MVRLAGLCLLLAGCGRFGFGDEVQDAPADTERALQALSVMPPSFSTSSTSFVDIPDAALTIPPSVGSRWVLLTSAGLESTSGLDVTVEARYLVDEVERGLGGTQNSAASRPGPWQHVYVIDGTAAEQHVIYQLREATGATATISNLHAIAIPLPADAVHYASVDAEEDVVMAAATAPQTTLSLGALSGDFVFLMSVNARDYPGLSDVYVEWRGPDGSIWLDDTQQPREGWQSIFAMQRATVDLSDAAVALYAHYGSGPTSQVAYARAVAIRADAFASVDFGADDVQVTTTSATPTQTVQLAPTASAASTYLYVSSVRLEEDCTVVPDAERGVYTIVDDDSTSVFHATDNCSYTATYGTARILPTPPASVAVAYSSGNGLPVVHDGTQLLLVGLR